MLFSILIFLFFRICLVCEGAHGRAESLYCKLPPNQLFHRFAYYTLFPEHPLGKKVFDEALQGILGDSVDGTVVDVETISQSGMINLLIGIAEGNTAALSMSPLMMNSEVWSRLEKRFKHFSLKGHHLWSEEEILILPPEEIDVARALFVSQWGGDRQTILFYERQLDLMAAQVLCRLPTHPSPDLLIREINHLIFDQMGFRFPPQSLHIRWGDSYTFLPSVLDSRRGVCLGVSLLYLSLAQRLGLNLEIVTPPGHIYVRCIDQEREINIETTARGVHIETSHYQGIEGKPLRVRSLKDVVGMTYFNQASVYLQGGEYSRAFESYQKALLYMPSDPWVLEFIGYTHVLMGKKEEAEKIFLDLQRTSSIIPLQKGMMEDFFIGELSPEGVEAILMHVDDDRQGLSRKKDRLEQVVNKYPRFRMARVSLAGTWLALHHPSRALEVLTDNLSLFSDDVEIHYYLSLLYIQQTDYRSAWKHLHHVEKILKQTSLPKEVKILHYELSNLQVEPLISDLLPNVKVSHGEMLPKT